MDTGETKEEAKEKAKEILLASYSIQLCSQSADAKGSHTHTFFF